MTRPELIEKLKNDPSLRYRCRCMSYDTPVLVYRYADERLEFKVVERSGRLTDDNEWHPSFDLRSDVFSWECLESTPEKVMTRFDFIG